jgi:transglutaminase-like putative cysteine protease
MRHSAIRSIVLSLLIAAAAALLASLSARADDAKKDFAGYTRYVWYHVHYDVNPDGTHVETISWALKVLSEQGVDQAQEASVSVSDRLEKMEVLSAYTLKQDGRKIIVPATNFQDETNTGKGSAAPMFSDIRTRTVAYPDVAVGDTVVLSYKLTQTEATFPGNFSALESFSKFEVYDDVQVSLSAPKSLGLRVYSRGVEGGEAPSNDGRSNWAWSYKNQQMATPETGSVSSLDYGPLIVATTFKDYGALAAAYDARAKTKAVQTDRIKKLANDLTQNARTPREQAKALYDWVAQNIKFAGNCVGHGSVVPHEADVVLANRMGDCKDHTTLLQALLAVKGIASTPTLINSGNAYTLPEAPTIEAFNHVISYIPSLGLYADSTSPYTSFGSLPAGDAGKPVVRTVDFKGIEHTPLPNWKDNSSNSTTVLKINPDGSGEGETKIAAIGEFADAWRYGMLYMQPNMEDSWLRRALAANGFTGTGTIDKGDLKDRTDTYSYGAKYKISDAINLPGPGAMYIRSPFDAVGNISSFLADVSDPDPTVNFMCSGGYSKSEVTITLPKDVKVLAMPRNAEIKGKYQTYKATYQQKDGTVTAVREIEDRTPGPVCAPAVAADYKKFAIAVRKELRTQLLYQ